MNDLQPLRSLLEQASAERDTVFAEHQRAFVAQRAAETQADQLATYRHEYGQRFGSRFGSAGAIELMQCYQGFMTRLDDAVAQQRQIVAQATERAEAVQARLLAAELRVASVRKLIERRVAEAGLQHERREQKATDEFASRAAWQRLAAGADARGFGA